ncbi:MAG: ABC transporter permease [Candidatus Acidiferrales bacterium]
MKRLTRFGSFFINLFRRSKTERELDEEIRAHLEMLTREKISLGMSPNRARRAAQIELGGVEQVKEEVRSSRAGAWLDTLCQDVRFSLRMSRKNPGFTAVIVLTLALGIGANTAIFSFINGTLLRSFSYRDADRLMLLWSSNPSHGWVKNIVSPADFADWKSRNRSFEDLAAFEDWSPDLAGNGPPQIVNGGRLTSNAFRLLGVKPAMGRDFDAAEGRPGAPHVVILSHALWQQNFGGDPSILGKAIRLNRENFTVVGIMPAGFEFPPDYYYKVDLWIPLPFDAASAARNIHEFFVFGRLRQDVSMTTAQGEMNIIARRIQQAYPVTDAGWEVSLQTLRASVTEDVRPILLVLLMAVAFVLLIACVNVANLQLSRAVVRQREIAIRTALGAHRTRLIRQSLVESVFLSLMGGAVGVLLAFWGIRAILSAYLAQNPGFEAVGINGRVLWFTLLLSLVTAIVFGVVPALVSSRLDWNKALKEAGRASGVSSASHRLRGM